MKITRIFSLLSLIILPALLLSACASLTAQSTAPALAPTTTSASDCPQPSPKIELTSKTLTSQNAVIFDTLWTEVK